MKDKLNLLSYAETFDVEKCKDDTFRIEHRCEDVGAYINSDETINYYVTDCYNSSADWVEINMEALFELKEFCELMIKQVIIMAQEKTFENKIKKYLEQQGCWYVKFFANAYTRSGIPDLITCIGGNFVAIEVKAQNGKVSDLQKYQRDKIREAGGISIVLYPDQFEDFKLLVDDLLMRPEFLKWTDQESFDR